MELLQAVQYAFIAADLTDPACDSTINKILTLLGFLHICLQPYFCHVINCSLTNDPRYKGKYEVILRLCLIGGGLLFLRYFLSAEFLGLLGDVVPAAKPTLDYYAGRFNLMQISEVTGGGITDHSDSTEWLRGTRLCTFKSKIMWHLGWSVPMADPSYYIMSASIHSFLMFAPFFALVRT